MLNAQNIQWDKLKNIGDSVSVSETYDVYDIGPAIPRVIKLCCDKDEAMRISNTRSGNIVVLKNQQTITVDFVRKL